VTSWPLCITSLRKRTFSAIVATAWPACTALGLGY
jgi:hypothetical protein